MVPTGQDGVLVPSSQTGREAERAGFSLLGDMAEVPIPSPPIHGVQEAGHTTTPAPEDARSSGVSGSCVLTSTSGVCFLGEVDYATESHMDKSATSLFRFSPGPDHSLP